MNKLITLIAGISFSAISFASAEVKIGASVGFGKFDIDGTETIKSAATTTKGSHSKNVMIPAIFAELGHKDYGIYVGMDYTNVAALGEKRTAKVDIDTDDSANTAGTNSAGAEVQSLQSIYLIKTIFDTGFYLKAGLASADVVTNENLATGSTYGNKSIDGNLYGVGYEKQSDDSGFFVRGSYEVRDYDSFTLVSSVDADSVSNTVKGEVDSSEFKISIGRAF
jgi:hypothetical protein